MKWGLSKKLVAIYCITSGVSVLFGTLFREDYKRLQDISQRYNLRYIADTNRDFKVGNDETKRVYEELKVPYADGKTLEELSRENVARYLSSHPKAK